MPSGQKQQQLPGPVPHQYQGPAVSWGGAALERKPVTCYMVHFVRACVRACTCLLLEIEPTALQTVGKYYISTTPPSSQ